MSCNIIRCQIREMKNLKVPIHSFYKHKRKDWHPTPPNIIDTETMEVELECGDLSIKGILKEQFLTITDFDMCGEGSGTFKNCILDEALKDSTGYLECNLIWESGDVEKYIVFNGNIIENDLLEE